MTTIIANPIYDAVFKYLMEDQKVANKERTIYGLPIVSIYILGHCLSDLKEPVIYVRRHYLDYDDKVLPAPDRFIESLTHDSIIVQIPLLAGRTRNRLEKILSVFDQEFQKPGDEHLLEISDDSFVGDDVQYLVQRLLKAAAAPEVRRAMEIEDEILSEIEARDTTIMIKDREIEQKEQVIEQKEQELEQNKQMLRSMAKMLCQNGMPVESIAKQLSMPIEQVQLLVGSAGE